MSLHLAEGTLFAGRYRIVKNLAAGGMGAVYEAVHVETNRRKALKVMHAHLFANDDMRERFKREARISAEIESEFIVDVSDAGVDETTKMPFLVMELLRGEELGRRLKRMGRFAPDEALTYLRQTAMALDKTHAASIVHRDLKPENLFWTQREDGSPRVKILDFGVAKLVAKGGTGAGATQILGSPVYMAPEQFRVDTKLTGAADIFALGMMAFELLVGKWYWHKEMKMAPDVMAFAIVAFRGPQESAVQRAAELGVELPAEFDVWFRRITALEPTARFSKASEAVQALEQVFEDARVSGFGGTVPLLGALPSAPTPMGLTPLGATPSSMTPPVATLPPRSVERRSPPLIAIGTMVLGVAGATGGAVWFFTRPTPDQALQDETSTEVVPSRMPLNTASPGPSAPVVPGPVPPEPSVAPATSISPMASSAVAAPSSSSKTSPRTGVPAVSTKSTGALPKPTVKQKPDAFGDMN